ncbi:hypothetical protein Ancab_003794 [Ancistrocladus abbreviatus]
MKAINSSSLSSHNSGVFPSPEMPCHGVRSLRICEGWSSERVPPSRYGSRRYINAAALMPFSSGRALPSKWDDAERWISSPVLGNGISRIPLVQSQRPAKSKSGPLGPSGLAFCGSNSPVLPAVNDASVRNSVTVDSPVSARELPADRFSISDGGGRKSCPGKSEQDLGFAREWLEMLSKLPYPISQGDTSDNTMDTETRRINDGISRRDAATQMLSEVSTRSSSTQRSSVSSWSSQLEIKDVQVDKQATPIQFSEKCADKMRLQREEAKINVWENLQKAKAEAAIRKLEMKLEKKRISSMDKIMKKLRRAQLKAEKKRSSLSEGQCNVTSQRSTKMAFLLKYLNKFNKKLGRMLG